MVISEHSVVSSNAPAGVCERFKIINNNKIPCTVNFAISPAAGPGNNEPPPPPENAKAKKGKAKAAAGGEGERAPGEASPSIIFSPYVL